MPIRTLGRAAALALCLPFPALAGMTVEVEILDRRSGDVLPVYWHEGERYVAGEPGREYEIRLRNRAGSRALAVTSVDGVDVITGRTASDRGGGYVLDAWDEVRVEGWCKSLDEVAAFYFTALPDSYAARTGRPDNVGVIGVALYRERAPARSLESERSARAEAPSPSAGALADSASAENQLGTGHGRRLDSGAVYTEFARASDSPDAVIRIYYDSRRNLLARGVIPRPRDRYARRLPDPFPESFVPDP